MRYVKKSSFTILSLFFFSFGIATVLFSAEDEALVAKGKELFGNKEGLGTKIACILCHKGDKAISVDRVQQLGDTLPDVINTYVVEKAKGTAFAKDSEEMKALAAYLRSGQK